MRGEFSIIRHAYFLQYILSFGTYLNLGKGLKYPKDELIITHFHLSVQQHRKLNKLFKRVIICYYYLSTDFIHRNIRLYRRIDLRVHQKIAPLFCLKS